MAEQAAINNSLSNPKFTYEGFDLRRVDQTFIMPESDAFNRSVLLWKDIYDENKTWFSERRSSSTRVTIEPHRYYFNSDWFEVSQIDKKMSIRQTVTMAHTLFSNDENLMYGILMHDGKKFFNPLHPLNAQAMIRKFADIKLTSSRDFDEELYTVMVFTYKPKVREEQKFLFDESAAEIFTKHLLNVLGLLESKSQYAESITEIRSQNITFGSRNLNYMSVYPFSKIEYLVDTIRASEDGKVKNDVHLQPVQLINNGLAAPYYGIVAQKHSRETGLIGFQLSPMMSCNIGQPSVTVRNNVDVEVSGLSVCTGSESNNSDAGRLTLNHANLGSPYFSDVLTSGSFCFAKTSVRMALGIYSEFFDLPRIDILGAIPPKAPISFDEFKKKNPSAKFSDYIKSIKK